jgi:hypothetical protein
MAESVKQRVAASLPPEQQTEHLYKMIEAVRLDLEALRNLLATHVHSGITAGGANTAVPTVVIAAAALNVQP